MIEISRRWFLFGTAAVVATAVAPPSLEVLERIATKHVYLKRHIVEIVADFDVAPNTPSYIATVRLAINEQTYFNIAMNVNSIFRWIAAPNNDAIIQMPEDIFKIETSIDIARIYMICLDWIDDGPPIHVVETFPTNGQTPPQFIYTDNSLEARLARQKAYTDNNDDNDDCYDDNDDCEYGDDYENG